MREAHASHAPFTPQEVEAFHAADRAEAKIIVLLMTSIFSIGLALYLIVLYYVMAA